MPPTLMENGHGAVSESIHDLIFKEPPLKLIINLQISCPRLPLVASGASSRLRSDFFSSVSQGSIQCSDENKKQNAGGCPLGDTQISVRTSSQIWENMLFGSEFHNFVSLSSSHTMHRSENIPH